MHLILCGMTACGKTTVGKALSEKLRLPFMDTDQRIEQQAKLSCREIYSKHGQEHFRSLEKKQLLEMPTDRAHVIAVGGGTLNDPENCKILQSLGQIVYLKCDTELLWERISKKELPAFLDPNHPYQSFEQIYLQRVPFYEKTAHGIVNCQNLSLEEIVWEVTLLAPFLKSPLGENPTEKLSV